MKSLLAVLLFVTVELILYTVVEPLQPYVYECQPPMCIVVDLA